ncbi:hypothetical protein B5F88_19240 [Flavonifractor sp. An306]|nr:hypothetical protein B5F88_19240 [Flavonifractor sp. An306]
MNMHGLEVIEIPGTQGYIVFTKQGLRIAQIWLGQDGQKMQDAITMGFICKALAKRWDIKAK